MNLNEKKITLELSKLPTDRQILFAIHMTKRLWPSYVAFCKTEKFGDHNFLKHVLAVAHSFFTGELDQSHIRSMRTILLKNTPDSEAFSSMSFSYALDACAACDDLLSLLENGDRLAAERISELALNSVAVATIYYLERDNGEKSKDEILASRIAKEFAFQLKLIQYLLSDSFNELVTEAFEIEYSSSLSEFNSVLP